MTSAADLARAEAVDPAKALVPVAFARNQARVDAGFVDKILRVVGKIPFADDAAAAYYCARDPETPTKVKAVLLAALAYFAIPTDALPDFLAAIGFGDDAAVLATTLTIVGGHIRDSHRAAAQRLLRLSPRKAKSPSAPP